ncbi:MAG TPA: hypothetical protein VG096_20425 [Bryobacteraceae bacterium]|jgi:hypothetical protein|nr:hypothetical protein [Bryobacteraceae bacterium]
MSLNERADVCTESPAAQLERGEATATANLALQLAMKWNAQFTQVSEFYRSKEGRDRKGKN